VRRFNRYVVLAVTIVVASTITSCASSKGDAAGTGKLEAIKPTAVKAEYLQEQSSLTLAPGWTWPDDPTPRSVADDGSNLVYQRGYGTTAADHYWYCSWEAAMVTAPTAAARDEALKNLQTVKRTHYYKADLLPPDRRRFDAILTNAGLGDLTGMQFDVTNNCPAGAS
jgi:hypothetical protein